MKDTEDNVDKNLTEDSCTGGSSSDDSENSSSSESESESISESESVKGEPSDLTAIIRRELRRALAGAQKRRKKKVKERKVKSKNVRRLLRDFRVPKEHPIFVKPEEVEKWIMDMELLHSEYTNTEMGNLDNPNFITKLVMYFDEEWGAAVSFENLWGSFMWLYDVPWFGSSNTTNT